MSEKKNPHNHHKYGYSTYAPTSNSWSTTAAPVDPETVLEEAQRLVYGERAELYGSTLKQHEDIAAIWSVLLNTKVTAEMVALCMVGMKLVRTKNTMPDVGSEEVSAADAKKHRDSVVDIAGYAGVIGKCATERGWWK